MSLSVGNRNYSYSSVEQDTKFQILESNSIKDAVALVRETDVILCDLDNTLFTARNPIGSAMFWDIIVKKTQEKLNLNFKEAAAKIGPLSERLDVFCGSRPVDPEAPRVLHELEDRGYLVLGFSARGANMAAITLHLLKVAGYRLKGLPQIRFSIASKGGELSIYENGVVFCGQVLSKGDVLTALSKRINIKSVLVFDDIRKNLETMKEACQEMDIPFRGVRFSKMDFEAAHFNEEMGLLLLRKFLECNPDLKEEYSYLVTD